MTLLLSTLLGGIGLFLLGMILMSDGLKAAAGSALQRILERSTGTTFRAFATGAGLTAVVQSSSATTLATIGFVSAGLLTFPSALGVIIGANVGTTSTGWIVALLGLRFNFGTVALPLIGIGALLRLLSSGSRAHLGMALAGFGLIFVAIDLLRGGMGDLALRIDLGAFTAATLSGRLVLVLIGAVMTVLLQSSSAAVALTLTAVHTGAIGLVEAAFLVIGQSLGTSVKAALAAIGASVPAKRTAAAHILFSVLATVIAYLAATPLLALSATLAEAFGAGDPAIVLTIFHTGFNGVSAALVMPFLPAFAGLVSRIVPERIPALTRHLDRTLVEVPAVAVEAALRTMREIGQIALQEARALATDGRPHVGALEEARAALDETHRFLGNVRSSRDSREEVARRHALLHAGDHISRLISAVRHAPAGPLPSDPEVQGAAAELDRACSLAIALLKGEGDGEAVVEHLQAASDRQAEHRRTYRAELLRRTATGEVVPEEALSQLDLMRHMDRVLYHAWRALHHLVTPTALSTFEPEEEEVLL